MIITNHMVFVAQIRLPWWHTPKSSVFFVCLCNKLEISFFFTFKTVNLSLHGDDILSKTLFSVWRFACWIQGPPPQPASVGVSLQLNVVKMLWNVSGFLTLFRPLSFSQSLFCCHDFTLFTPCLPASRHTHSHSAAQCFVCLLPACLSEGEDRGVSVWGCRGVCVCVQWVGNRQMNKWGDGEKRRDVWGRREPHGLWRKQEQWCGLWLCLSNVCVRVCVCVSDKFLFIPELM